MQLGNAAPNTTTRECSRSTCVHRGRAGGGALGHPCSSYRGTERQLPQPTVQPRQARRAASLVAAVGHATGGHGHAARGELGACRGRRLGIVKALSGAQLFVPPWRAARLANRLAAAASDAAGHDQHAHDGKDGDKPRLHVARAIAHVRQGHAGAAARVAREKRREASALVNAAALRAQVGSSQRRQRRQHDSNRPHGVVCVFGVLQPR